MENSVKNNDDLLGQLCDWVQASSDLTQSAREASERNRDYYDGKQLSPQEITALKNRKQPAIVNNRIKRKIDFLKGVERKLRTDPKAFPRNPSDEKTAEAATDALRYAVENCYFDQIASQSWEYLLIEGTEAAEVRVKQNRDGSIDPEVKLLHWDRIFWDAHARFLDFSDAKYLGVVVWMDQSDALKQWPDAEDRLAVTYDSDINETLDDRPRWQWADKKRKRVKVVQLYWQSKEGWMCAEFVKGGWLKEPQLSPYLDEDQQPDCPLVFQSAYIDRENNRYGLVSEMIDLQDEINKRRSKLLHLLNSRQTWGELGAVDNVRAAKEELHKPDGHIEITPGMRFEVLPTGDMARGQAELLAQATQEIDLAGPNAAMQGKQGGDPSGRAIIAQQQGGYVELEHLLDTHKYWKHRIYRQIWNRIRQYWANERWVRVTDDDSKLKWVGLNVPFTLADQLEAEGGIPPEMMGDPRLNEQAGVHNAVVELDVDITLDDSPDMAVAQQEQFESLMNAMSASGQPLPLELLIELAPNIRNRDKVLEKLRPNPEAQQMQQQQQDQQNALMAADKEADIRKKNASASKDEAQAMQFQERQDLALMEIERARSMDLPMQPDFIQ